MLSEATESHFLLEILNSNSGGVGACCKEPMLSFTYHISTCLCTHTYTAYRHTQHIYHSPHTPYTCQIHHKNLYTDGHLQRHSWDNPQFRLNLLFHCSFLFCKNISMVVSCVPTSLVWDSDLQCTASSTEGRVLCLGRWLMGLLGCLRTLNPTVDDT